jgi:molybdate transport system substrate-binding protein
MKASDALGALTILLGAGLAFSHGAHADEVKLLAARVLRPVLAEIAPEFERSTGHTVDISYEPAGAITDRIDRGEPADAAIIQMPSLVTLGVRGRIDSRTVRPIAVSGVSVGILKGEAKPDIGSVDAFTRTLLNARSVAYPDPVIANASGIHFVAVMKRLGIDEKLRPKLVVWKAPFPEFARTSEAQLAITQAMDILISPRYELVGPLPAALQDFEAFTWAAGVGSSARHPIAARALIDFLTTPFAAAIIRKRGMEPAASTQ